jgi:NADPH-dependent curcumin reductase CurA
MSRPLTNRRILFAQRPRGVPTEACFRIEEAPVPELAEGEVLVRNDVLSVDPYIRMRMEEKDSYAPVMKIGELLVGRTVGEIVESRDAAWPVGAFVVGRLGWQDYSIAKAAELQRIDPAVAPLTTYLGALGSTGTTAWVGLVHIGQVKPGESVLVSAATGAVGSVVGQLAKRRGCRVVGIAGGARKCAVAREVFGFDDAVDYKAPDFAARLVEAAGKGFDVYFDNVGGEILDTTLGLMHKDGRIPLCGLVSQYNETEPYRMRNLREVFNKRLTLRGFVLSDHRELWPAANQELAEAYGAGELIHRETVTDGLENAPSAFIAMLDGANIGKQLVRLRETANA